MTGWLLLIIFIAAVGFLVWLLQKMPSLKPFTDIMVVVGIIAVVVVCIQFFFGIDLLAELRSAVHR